MKKSILAASLVGLFFICGSNLSAQVSKTVAIELEATTKSAVETINEEKSLSDVDKKKFVDRIEFILNTAKKKDDKVAKTTFEKEYNRIAENYLRITNKSLPVFKSSKN